MFTYGRVREKENSACYIKNKEHLTVIYRVIDSVHDFLDNKLSNEELKPILYSAFADGGSGVWEQTETWIRKLSYEDPDFLSLWYELSNHKYAKVRWKVACVIDSMPTKVAFEIGYKLLKDKGKRVRECAEDRLSHMHSQTQFGSEEIEYAGHADNGC